MYNNVVLKYVNLIKNLYGEYCSTQGIQPTLDVDNMEQAKEFIQAFDQLVAHAKKANIEIPGLDKVENELEIDRNIIDNLDGSFDGLDEKTKVTKISQNLASAANKIIDAMNAKLEVCLDQEGNFSKVVKGKNENLSEDDIPQLKEKLKAMDDAQDSLYRIKQIEVEEPSNSTQMKM